MACGVPGIGARIGGMPEIVSPGDNGYLVDLGDVEQASKYALQILTNAELHQRLKKGALDTVKNRFHSTAILGQYEAIYERLLDRSERA